MGSQRGTFRPKIPLVHRTCPYCATPEDFAHLLSCADPRARKAQYDAMKKLRKAINGTPAAAPRVRVIKQWTDAHSSDQIDLSPGVDMYEPAIRCALASQLLLGWTNFFCGFLCLDWGYIVTLPDPLSALARNLPLLRLLRPRSGSFRTICWLSGPFGTKCFTPIPFQAESS